MTITQDIAEQPKTSQQRLGAGAAAHHKPPHHKKHHHKKHPRKKPAGRKMALGVSMLPYDEQATYDTFVAAWTDLATDAERRATTAAAARERAASFTWDRAVDAFEAVLTRARRRQPHCSCWFGHAQCCPCRPYRPAVQA